MTQLSLVYDYSDNTKERSAKLTGDKLKIFQYLSDGKCWLVSDLARAIGNRSETSVSANVRNLRKDGFEIKLIKLGHGLNGYQLVNHA